MAEMAEDALDVVDDTAHQAVQAGEDATEMKREVTE
jgi:hypothetical protein